MTAISNLKPARITGFPAFPPKGFPFWAFKPWDPASLHYRIARFHQYWLAKKKIDLATDKPIEEAYIYASLVSTEDELQCWYSLASLLKSQDRIPQIVLGCDHGTSPEEVREKFSQAGLQLRTVTIEEAAAFHGENGHRELAWFCRRHVFGFKMALNLMVAEDKPVLYGDSDVLWFESVAEELSNYSTEALYASLDYNSNPYDPWLMKLIAEKYGFVPECGYQGCAGVTLFNDPEPVREFVRPFIERLRTEDRVDRLSEQTLIAAFAKWRNAFLSENLICMSDLFTRYRCSQAVNERWKGRHYAGPWRSQFWIDVMRLVC